MAVKFYLIHDLDLGFSRSNFEKAVYREWESRLPWNESGGWVCSMFDLLCDLELWLDLGFWGRILKKPGMGGRLTWCERDLMFNFDLIIHIDFHLRFSYDDVIKWNHFPRYWPFLPVTGEFSSQRPVTRSFDVFFDLRLNKRLSKQSRRLWLETPSRSLWRQCKVGQIF